MGNSTFISSSFEFKPPRVRDVDEGVDTTPDPPQDTDEEEEGSTSMLPRSTDVTDDTEPENKHINAG
jgi:hypothetical protein